MNVLYNAMKPHLDRCNVSRSGFREQLEIEYETTVQDGVYATMDDMASNEEVAFIIDGMDVEHKAHLDEKSGKLFLTIPYVTNSTRRQASRLSSAFGGL